MNVWQCYHHWSVTVHILWTSLELKCLPRYVVYCILAYQGISSVYILILGTSYQGRTENKVRCMQVRFTLQLQQIRNAATCAHTHAACYMITLPERQNVHEETITQCVCYIIFETELCQIQASVVGCHVVLGRWVYREGLSDGVVRSWYKVRW
jgi:hypothetical protein